VQREPILDARAGLTAEALKPLFDRLMTLIPALSCMWFRLRAILWQTRPCGHIQRQKIDIAPLNNF
jgi:hypothetical protein